LGARRFDDHLVRWAPLVINSGFFKPPILTSFFLSEFFSASFRLRVGVGEGVPTHLFFSGLRPPPHRAVSSRARSLASSRFVSPRSFSQPSGSRTLLLYLGDGPGLSATSLAASLPGTLSPFLPLPFSPGRLRIGRIEC